MRRTEPELGMPPRRLMEPGVTAVEAPPTLLLITAVLPLSSLALGRFFFFSSFLLLMLATRFSTPDSMALAAPVMGPAASSKNSHFFPLFFSFLFVPNLPYASLTRPRRVDLARFLLAPPLRGETSLPTSPLPPPPPRGGERWILVLIRSGATEGTAKLLVEVRGAERVVNAERAEKERERVWEWVCRRIEG
jgi:hypothetical protein